MERMGDVIQESLNDQPVPLFEKARGGLLGAKEILSELNNHLVQVMERGSFVTATILLFDSSRKTVSFARAGHTPIIRRQGSEVDPLIPSGLALGLGTREVFEPALQQYTVRYDPEFAHASQFSLGGLDQKIVETPRRLLDSQITSCYTLQKRLSHLCEVCAFDVECVYCHLDCFVARSLRSFS